MYYKKDKTPGCSCWIKSKKEMFLLVIMNLRDLFPGNLVAKESDTKIQ